MSCEALEARLRQPPESTRRGSSAPSAERLRPWRMMLTGRSARHLSHSVRVPRSKPCGSTKFSMICFGILLDFSFHDAAAFVYDQFTDGGAS
jgi:hypothetical protein